MLEDTQATMNGETHNAPTQPFETDVLIVGAGPAGASLACFLARYGITGLIISKSSGTADTPRAHINNMPALECLRDIGLEEACYQLGHRGHSTSHVRWTDTMFGEEMGRIWAWGNDPARKGDYDDASPCEIIDLPQTLLEPLLIQHATTNGFKVRWDTTIVSFSEDPSSGKITSRVKDRLTGHEYDIVSQYLFGADGARSQVAKQLDLPFHEAPKGGPAVNIVCSTADMTEQMKHRGGNLHWVLQMDRDTPPEASICVVRMVKPWREWLVLAFPQPGATYEEPTQEQWLETIRGVMGPACSDIKILSISRWQVNETVAELYSRGNIFCLGDAVHRHPPSNGLGSNTCIQDAYNLAWKLSLVKRGLAHPSLLHTYNAERQPVGANVVARANKSLRHNLPIWQVLGLIPHGSAEAKRAALALLKEDSERGRTARQQLSANIAETAHEFHGLGTEMGDVYSSTAIYTKDEPEPHRLSGRAAQDPVLYHEPSTYPGARLPHAWLNTLVPAKPISTIDLVKGEFCLLTGLGGQRWKSAAEKVSSALGVRVNVYGIGKWQDWEDLYGRWAQVRGVEESGAVLVRPDRYVAWRAQRVLESEEACVEKLGRVMRALLGLDVVV